MDVVAVDEAVGDELGADGIERGDPARVGGRDELAQRHEQQRGVEHVGVVVLEASSSCLKMIVAQLMVVCSVVNIVAYSVFHAAAVAMTSSQTAKLAVISVRHWGALIR